MAIIVVLTLWRSDYKRPRATVLLDLIHAADGATNDTTAVKPSRPPLIVAVERGDRRAVEKLLRDGADVEVRTPDGVTPLYAAAFHDQADMLRLLIKAGAKVDGRAAHGRTALFPAAARLTDWPCGLREVAKALKFS